MSITQIPIHLNSFRPELLSLVRVSEDVYYRTWVLLLFPFRLSSWFIPWLNLHSLVKISTTAFCKFPIQSDVEKFMYHQTCVWKILETLCPRQANFFSDSGFSWGLVIQITELKHIYSLFWRVSPLKGKIIPWNFYSVDVIIGTGYNNYIVISPYQSINPQPSNAWTLSCQNYLIQ